MAYEKIQSRFRYPLWQDDRFHEQDDSFVSLTDNRRFNHHPLRCPSSWFCDPSRLILIEAYTSGLRDIDDVNLPAGMYYSLLLVYPIQLRQRRIFYCWILHRSTHLTWSLCRSQGLYLGISRFNISWKFPQISPIQVTLRQEEIAKVCGFTPWLKSRIKLVNSKSLKQHSQSKTDGKIGKQHMATPTPYPWTQHHLFESTGTLRTHWASSKQLSKGLHTGGKNDRTFYHTYLVSHIWSATNENKNKWK